MNPRWSFAPDRDDVHVEVATASQDVVHHTTKWAKRGTRPARAQHDLGTAFRAGEGDQRHRRVVLHNLLERTFELRDQLLRQRRVRVVSVRPVGTHDVYRDHFSSRARGDSCRSTKKDLVRL